MTRMRNGCLVTLLCACGALAHIPLTPAILEDAFGDIRAASAVAAAAEPDAQAAAHYALAVEVTELAELLNQELRLHGTGQQALLDEAVARAAALGLEIVWSGEHQRYFYTGDAYRRHLALDADGIDAANSRFQLLETGFLLGDPENRTELEARIGMAREYLERYPELGNAGRVAMFLAVDYRDLWRLCAASGDADCAERSATRNREHLERTIARHDGARTGQLARTFLARFEAEIRERRP